MFASVYQWYRGFIPPYGTDKFYRFLESAGRLAGYVLEDHQKRHKINVYFADVPTAYTNFPRLQMVLPNWSLMPSMWGQLNQNIPTIPVQDYSAAVLCAVTGLLIHESGHFVFTEDRPIDIVNKATHPLMKEFLTENGHALMALFQTIDDLYIEHQLMKEPYGFFLEELGNLLFSEKNMKMRHQAFVMEPTGKTVLPFIFNYKNPVLRNRVEWDILDPKVLDILDASPETHNKYQRGTQACQVYELLRDLFKQDQDQDYPQSSQNNSDNDTRTEGGTDGQDHFITGEEMTRELANALNIVTQKMGQKGQEIQGKIEKFIREPLPDPLEFDGNIPPIVHEDVSSYGRSGYGLQPSPAFRSFGRILLNLRSKNYPPGPPLEKGKRIINTRMSRIATDGKIFGYPYIRDTREAPEVKISINASGSMRGIYPQVMAAAYGAFNSLKESRIQCSVYAHTTTGRDGDNAPLLIHIADTEDIGAQQLFNRALEVRMAMSYDGAILRELGESFSKRPNQKIIVEMNDGEPNCDNYTGHNAVKHVKDVVDYLRNKGIIVLCMSLDHGVIKPNNVIYGERYNVDATHDIALALEHALQDVLV